MTELIDNSIFYRTEQFKSSRIYINNYVGFRIYDNNSNPERLYKSLEILLALHQCRLETDPFKDIEHDPAEPGDPAVATNKRGRHDSLHQFAIKLT